MSLGVLLMVDDDRQTRDTYKGLLDGVGFSVMIPRDGEDALQMIYTVHPKLLLTEAKLNGSSGADICKRMRKTHGGVVPVIIFTAAQDPDTVQACLQAGADDFVLKSWGNEKVVKRLKHWATSNRLVRGGDRHAKAREAAIDKIEATKPLSPETDETTKLISDMVNSARNLAPHFGKTTDEKLFLLGYVAGVVQQWASDSGNVKQRSRDYLQVVLKETKLLSEEEIDMMLKSWSELNTAAKFKIALKTGYSECKVVRTPGNDSALMAGLSNYHDLVGDA